MDDLRSNGMETSSFPQSKVGEEGGIRHDNERVNLPLDVCLRWCFNRYLL